MRLTCVSIRAGAGALIAVVCLHGSAASAADAAASDAIAPAADAPQIAAPQTTAPQADTAPAAAPTTEPAKDAAAPATPAAEPVVAAPPDPNAPIEAALSGALDALVAGDAKENPVGAGDWRGALKAVRDFYAARQFAPLWVDRHGLTANGQSALARLMRANEDALDLSSFALPTKPLTDATPGDLAEAETTLSAAVVAYAMQASGSRIAPTSISRMITAHPSVADPAAVLAALAAAPDPDTTLEAYNPHQKGYRDLRDQLARARAPVPAPADPAPVAASPAKTLIPDGPSLGLGMHDPRVALVRVRLGVPADGLAGDIYDLPVAAAVQAFQRANGLPPNGALTPGTAAALSGGVAVPAIAGAAPSPARRIPMIEANMEMWRWEPHDMGEERIEINIPDFSLRMMDGDNVMRAARVIVGKPDTPTPVFSNSVKYILVNPVWRVPDSIIKKEFAPRLADDPNYLTDRGYEVKEVGGRMVVNQLPGDDNALGRIAFMFPNEHDVYLHDTNARGLFGAARRAFSHGCVRVEQPMALAPLVMGGESSGWTSARFQSMLGANERTVMLPHPVPIHIEYFTEFVDASGALQNRDDIYGIAARVAGTIAKTSQD
jgi:murein L,D-transpeptidase YcbB/YkuD